MRFVLHGVFAFLCSFGASTLAWAHAEEPNSQNVFATPAGDAWVLRANVGIVRSAQPDELICEEAFLGGDGWMLGVLGETEWVTFGETSVTRTEDGCQFDKVLDLERRPSDATVHAGSGGAAFIMNGAGDANGLWVSTDRGVTFSNIQAFDAATQQTTGVRYLSDTTLIVSGYSRTDDGAALVWSVDVSSGTATPIVPPDGVTYPYVIGAGGGHLLLLGRRGDQVVFWGTPDNIGEAELVASTWPTWAVLGEDGTTAWISGLDGGRGVERGTLGASGATWEAFAPDTTAGCVEPMGDDLLICGLNRFDTFDLLSVSAAGDVAGVMSFRDFAGVRSDCPADSSVGSVCPLVWREIAPYFGIDLGATGDMGTLDVGITPADMAADTSVPQTVAGGGEGGCCSTVRGENGGSLALLLLGLVGWRRRRALTQKMRRC